MLGLVARVEDNPQLQSLIVNEDWLVVDRLLRRRAASVMAPSKRNWKAARRTEVDHCPSQ